MLHENVVYLAMVLVVAGDFGYARAAARGQVRPNRVTWFLWTLIPMIAFVGELAEGVGKPALMTFTFGIGPLMIFTASFLNRQAYWRVRPLDVVCGALSAGGLVLWMITQHGLLAILLAVAADGLAGVPTLVKAYRHPSTEFPLAYWCAAGSGALTLLTLDHWNAAHYAFPGYIVVLCTTLAVLATFRIGDRLPARTPIAA